MEQKRETVEEIEQNLTLDEYHDISNLSDILDRPNIKEMEELGTKMADLFNSYPKMKGMDKILLSKNVTLQLIHTSVKNFIKYKSEIAKKEMEQEFK